MTALDPWNYALIGSAELPNFTEPVLVLNLHRSGLTVQHQFLTFGRQLRKGFIEINVFILSKRN
jgi:hypothetical protein